MSFSRKLKSKTTKVWEEGYNHPFLKEMGEGTLPEETFKFYLIQDYKYLLQYAKVFAIGAVKAESEDMIKNLTKIQHKILVDEMEIHRGYMKKFGIDKEEVTKIKSSLYNKTYTANMLATAQTGDLCEILAAILPCAWTYSDYATRLKEKYRDKLEGNIYKEWIESYSSPEFTQSYQWIHDAIDEMVENKTQEQRDKIVDIFESSVEFEYLFWDMAYKKEMSYLL